jgi:L-ascorbate metabolism protein UlaG (beta-lactamase superfamily)
MTRPEVYLKPNVMVEPLFNQWYAWSYLIAPETAAMYVANLHLKIMESFASAPQVHIAALKNPAMLGGPFINYGASRVAEIKALIEKTQKEQAPLVQFADAVRRLDDTLITEATGYSLEPLYEKTPDILRGYIELVYDARNNPSIRFIEGLLYKSPYYNPASQSICLSLVHDDDRPFILSTPTLEDDQRLHLKAPFSSEGLDQLFSMKCTPRPYAEIKDILHLAGEQDEQFSSFFEAAAGAQKCSNYDGGDVRIRYFGHACILIETDETSILCDPVISYKYETQIGRYTYADLPETIDYVLITHNHQDHCIFETLLQLRHKIKNLIVPRSSGVGIMDPSLKLIFQNIGFKNVWEIDEMETIEVAGGTITGLPFLGEHADLNIKTKIAYLVKLKGQTIVCAADSNNIEPRLYELIGEFMGSVDVIFLGMECDGAPLTWLYGPLLTKPLARRMDQSRRFDGSNYEKAIGIVNQLRPKSVYVYAMGQEPWLTFLTSLQYTEQSRPIVESDKLVEDCTRRGIIAKRLFGHEEIHLNSASNAVR